MSHISIFISKLWPFKYVDFNFIVIKLSFTASIFQYLIWQYPSSSVGSEKSFTNYILTSIVNVYALKQKVQLMVLCWKDKLMKLGWLAALFSDIWHLMFTPNEYFPFVAFSSLIENSHLRQMLNLNIKAGGNWSH